MAGPIASLFVSLGLDARTFTQGIDQAQKATKGFTSGTQLAFGVVGAAATGALLATTKFAVESQAAQGKFQAATGASSEQAKQFVKDMDGLAGSSGAVGVSFDKISEAGTQVAQQFGLTGKAGQAMTENFLEFSKVTGQDATGAVNDFDAALDAWGEPAGRATSLMDQLVASNQKYGTDAGPAAVQAITDMAPALQAMGMGLDDAIDVLNAFETAGIDAGSAAGMLQRGIKALKPGQDLNDLITQLGKIDDPLLRAQEAIKIFGKSGARIAQIIKPGMTSLDEFGISAEEAAGKTKTAADGMVTDADKIKGAFEKVQAGLRDIGTDVGPALAGVGGLVTAVSALGPKFVDAVKGLWQLVADSELVSAAARSAGLKSGGMFLAGFAGAILLVPILQDVAGKIEEGITKIFGGVTSAQIMAQVRAGVEKAHPEMVAAGEQVGTDIASGVPKGLALGPDGRLLYGPWLKDTSESGQPAAEGAGQHLAQGVSRGFDQGIVDMPAPPFAESRAWRQGLVDAENLGKGIVGAVTQGLMDDASKLDQTMSELADIIKNGLSPDQLKAEAAGRKTIRLFKQGMDSQKIGAVEKAQELAGASIKAIEDVADGGYLGGKDAKAVGIYLAGLANSGIDSQHTEAFLSGAGLSAKQIAGIKKQFPQFFDTGQTAAEKVNDGMLSKDWGAFGRAAAARWGAGYTAKIQQILQNISNAGPGTGGTGDRIGHNAGGGYVPPFGWSWVGEQRPELIRAGRSGLTVARVEGAGMGGLTNIFNFYGLTIANDHGLDELMRRIENRMRQRTRGANFQSAR